MSNIFSEFGLTPELLLGKPTLHLPINLIVSEGFNGTIRFKYRDHLSGLDIVNVPGPVTSMNYQEKLVLVYTESSMSAIPFNSSPHNLSFFNLTIDLDLPKDEKKKP